jgi:hypothetical protein
MIKDGSLLKVVEEAIGKLDEPQPYEKSIN